MQDSESDILVLGATGFTGRLITRYLSTHPQSHAFTLAVGARSSSKLTKLVQELSLPKSVRTIKIDVTNQQELRKVVKGTRVVINAVGPFWRWGTPVVRACVENGVHYVDITGETFWIRNIIHKFDYYATNTGSIIVPSCGMDSVPSDIAAFLSNRTLKSAMEPNEEPLQVESSTTAHKVNGTISGGTIDTMLMTLDEVPAKDLKDSLRDYAISPVQGRQSPGMRLLYRLPIPNEKTLVGGFFIMGNVNKAIVQRTFGLLEYQALLAKGNADMRPQSDIDMRKAQLARYGPNFVYDEFIVTPGRVSALVLSTALFFGIGVLSIFRPLRRLISMFLPQPGTGPSDEVMKSGSIISTNLTKSTSTPPVYVKSVLKGKGDPSYLLTAVMISESALCLLLPPPSETPLSLESYDPIANLPPLAKRGGILTPMTAFGDVLIKRLEETGRFDFGSWVIEDANHKKNV